MDNIVIFPRRKNKNTTSEQQELISTLRDLLAQAEIGELKSLMFAGMLRAPDDETGERIWSGSACADYGHLCELIGYAQSGAIWQMIKVNRDLL